MSKVILVQCTNKPLPFDDKAVPIQLLNVAGALQEKGYEPIIIDKRKDTKWEETLKKEVKQAILVGIQVTTGESLKEGFQVAKIAHEVGAPTAWMGIHPSVLPEETKKSKHVDYVIIGDAEISMVEICMKLENKHLKEPIQKIWDMRVPDLDKLPFTPFDLIDLKQYGNGAGLPILTSRGCPHNCSFCTNHAVNKGSWRSMSASRIIEHIEHYKEKYNIKDFKFFDDNFCADMDRVVQVSKKLVDEDVAWSTSCRIDYLHTMNDGLLNLMKRAGCWNLAFGFESGSPRILTLVNKHVTVQQMMDAITKLGKNGMGFGGTFVYGFPSEFDSDVLESLKLIDFLVKNAPSATFEAYSYVPCPGTVLFDMAVEYGFKSACSLEGWAITDFGAKPWMSSMHRGIIDRVLFMSNLIGRPNGKHFTVLQKMIRNNIPLFINNIRRGL